MEIKEIFEGIAKEWIQAIAVIVSGVAAVLAWVAKIRWSEEYAAAKDEIIRSKNEIVQSKEAEIKVLERTIEELHELTSAKVKDAFLSMKEVLEEYNEQLQKEVAELKSKIAEKDLIIEQLLHSEKEQTPRIQQLSTEKDEMLKELKEVQDVAYDLSNLTQTSGSINKWINDYFNLLFEKDISSKIWKALIASQIDYEIRIRKYLEEKIDEQEDKDSGEPKTDQPPTAS